MAQLLRIVFGLVLLAASIAFTFDSADAHRRRGHHHFGFWAAGPAAFGFGLGVRYGWPGPYYPYYGPGPYYYGPAYYPGPVCERIYIRKWRHGRYVLVPARRCW